MKRVSHGWIIICLKIGDAGYMARIYSGNVVLSLKMYTHSIIHSLCVNILKHAYSLEFPMNENARACFQGIYFIRWQKYYLSK